MKFQVCATRKVDARLGVSSSTRNFKFNSPSTNLQISENTKCDRPDHRAMIAPMSRSMIARSSPTRRLSPRFVAFRRISSPAAAYHRPLVDFRLYQAACEKSIATVPIVSESDSRTQYKVFLQTLLKELVSDKQRDAKGKLTNQSSLAGRSSYQPDSHAKKERESSRHSQTYR